MKRRCLSTLFGVGNCRWGRQLSVFGVHYQAHPVKPPTDFMASNQQPPAYIAQKSHSRGFRTPAKVRTWKKLALGSISLGVRGDTPVRRWSRGYCFSVSWHMPADGFAPSRFSLCTLSQSNCTWRFSMNAFKPLLALAVPATSERHRASNSRCVSRP